VSGGGCGGSSRAADSGDLEGITINGVSSKFEDVRLKDGERGGVTPPTPCRELIDVFLFSVGVDDLWLALMELELEVLRSALCGGLFVVGDETMR